jgi:hypothetical protein
MTKPTDPVTLLACAIATQEGYFTPGTFPQEHNNPGDLEYEGQIGASPVVGSPLAHFATRALGENALFRQLRAQIAEGQTVSEIIAQWAPSTQNDTSGYLQDVLQWTGLPAEVPVLELLPQLLQLNL